MGLTSTFSNNTATPAPPSTVGFKISKPGYDANRTAGQNYLFNSSWPSLAIGFETTIANPLSSTVHSVPIAHGLKFPPFASAWFYGPDPSGVGFTSRRYFMPVDATNFYLSNSIALDDVAMQFLNSATKVNIKCFNLDLSRDIDYTLAPGDSFSMPYDNSFGIKVAKPNKDISSPDLRNFILHSRCQSPLILAVKTQATANPANPTTVQYTSPYSYPVWVYGFIRRADNSYLYAPYYQQTYPVTKTDGFLSYLTFLTSGGGTDTGATIVVLRDPMFAANKVTAQY